MKQKRESLTDTFFTLSLFGMFAVCSFFLILIGIQVYRSSVSQMNDTYSTHTALSYTAEKLRRHDTDGGVSLGELDHMPALILREQEGTETYLTYIYYDSEHLYEVSVKEGTPVSSKLGEKILDVKNFSIEQDQNGFLKLSASDSNGTPITLLLHMKCQSPITKK